MFFTKLNKSFTYIILIIVLFFVASIFSINKAEAQFSIGMTVPTTDFLDIAQNTISAIKETAFVYKEFLLDPLANILAKQTLGKLTQGVLNFTSNGFDGNGAFVTNPQQYFGQIRSDALNQYMGNLSKPEAMCEPLRGSIMSTLTRSFNNRISPNVSGSILPQNAPGGPGCSLSGPIASADTYNDFVSGNFSAGGWDAWFNLTQNPENNIYGATSAAIEQGNNYASDVVATEQNRIDLGSGFKDVRDSQGKITTPGYIVANQVNNVVGSPVRQLENADELNEVISALVSGLIQKTLTSGLSSLSSLGLDSDDPRSSRDYDGNAYNKTMQDSANENTQSAANNIYQLGVNNNSGNDTNTRVNLALGRGTYTIQDGQGGDGRPELAVDGNTSEVLLNGFGSIAITRRSIDPFWQVDLGARDQTIGDIVVFRQTYNEGVAISGNDLLGTFKVFVYNPPSNDTDYDYFTQSRGNFNPKTSVTGKGIKGSNTSYGDLWVSDSIVAGNSVQKTITVNAPGRFVRVQKIDNISSNLRLAEVQIFQNNRPVITLNDSNPITIQVGQTFTNPTVATVKDDEDVTRTLAITTQHYKVNGQTKTPVSAIDTATAGIFQIGYNATDSGGAKAVEVFRTVNVISPDPTVTIQYLDASGAVLGQTITAGTVVTISWASQNMTASYLCTANSVPSTSIWTGAKGQTGTASLGALPVGTYSFGLFCRDQNNVSAKTASDSKTVTVN